MYLHELGLLWVVIKRLPEGAHSRIRRGGNSPLKLGCMSLIPAEFLIYGLIQDIIESLSALFRQRRAGGEKMTGLRRVANSSGGLRVKQWVTLLIRDTI